MPDVIIIGDGPAGLSAALFLAKNGQNVIVFGLDKTSMHYAMLYNYLGIPEITGSDFQRVAREQVQKFGAEIQAQEIISIEQNGAGFIVATASGERYDSKYLILAEGKAFPEGCLTRLVIGMRFIHPVSQLLRNVSVR